MVYIPYLLYTYVVYILTYCHILTYYHHNMPGKIVIKTRPE